MTPTLDLHTLTSDILELAFWITTYILGTRWAIASLVSRGPIAPDVLGSSFWARATSALVLVGIAASSSAGAFGRFGYSDKPDVPAFEVGPDGFKVRNGQADRFGFFQKSKLWKIVATTEISQTVAMAGGDRMPAKLKVDLTSPGFLLYVQRGLSLKLSTLKSPFLSWKEGSVGADVPTPDSPWVAVSFRDNQPPIVIGFLDGPGRLELKGRAGEWTIGTQGNYKGWVRVSAPNGTVARATTGAASLGSLSADIAKFQGLWSSPSPKVQSLEIDDSEATSVTARWTFDKPQACVPRFLSLSSLGGYWPTNASTVQRLPGYDEAGPSEILTGNVLTVRFPVTAMGPGTSLAIGIPGDSPLSTASAFDVQSVTELALSNLLACRDAVSQTLAKECSEGFLENAVILREPNSQQSVLYSSDAANFDLVAAHALLTQVRTSSDGNQLFDNPLLASVMWRRDWLTGVLWGQDHQRTRRAAGLAAIAGAASGTPQGRLDGALLVAGLAYERGLSVWMSRRGAGPPAKWLDPLPGLLKACFVYDVGTTAQLAESKALISPIRSYSVQPMWLVQGESGGLELKWNAALQAVHGFVFSGGLIEAQTGENCERVHVAQVDKLTIMDALPKAIGECRIKFMAGPVALPKVQRWPTFYEALK